MPIHTWIVLLGRPRLCRPNTFLFGRSVRRWSAHAPICRTVPFSSKQKFGWSISPNTDHGRTTCLACHLYSQHSLAWFSLWILAALLYQIHSCLLGMLSDARPFPRGAGRSLNKSTLFLGRLFSLSHQSSHHRRGAFSPPCVHGIFALVFYLFVSQ